MTSPDTSPNASPPLRPRKQKSPWPRRVVVALVASAAAGALGLAFRPKPTPVDVAKAARGPLRVTLEEDGKTRLKQRYLVSSPLVGTVRRIELRPGDRVEKGTVLARLLPLEAPLLDTRTKASAEARLGAARAASRQAEANAARAKTAYDLASKETERTRELARSGSLGGAALDRAEAEMRSRADEVTAADFGSRVAVHEAEVAAAAFQARKARSVDQFEIASPVAGVVLRVHQESESPVSPGTPLVELGDAALLEVVVDVLSTDAVRVPDRARATLERWGEDRPIAAHVRLVEPAATTRLSALGVEEQRVNVVLDLDDPRETWARLGDGFRVEARIVLWQSDDVLRVHEGALFRRKEGWTVFVVEEGRARARAVTVGHKNGLEAEIASGLREGETVVVHPGDRVTEGARIAPR